MACLFYRGISIPGFPGTQPRSRGDQVEKVGVVMMGE